MNTHNLEVWQREYPIKKSLQSTQQDNGIQAWCADMWSLLWNLLLENKDVQIHRELDFSWTDSPLSEWKEKSILHYSGEIKDGENYFDKTAYRNFMPWYDNKLLKISDKSCSIKIVEMIREYRLTLDSRRNSYSNTCIILYIEKEDLDKVEKAYECMSSN
ncbi:hypothetical protein BN1088_1120011 [Sphingobacterium sp. PM2-P1-29]|nr:hypothetical protein BN1088_1120011 [Sphingobacterium sp. PM2-P1-29]